jgi:hypothetical protein
MVNVIRNERGSAMVTALFFIIGLTVTAAIVVMVATSEHHVAHNEYTHVRSFYSSDAGGEEAINWIRTSDPVSLFAANGTSVHKLNTYSHLNVAGSTENNEYKYDIKASGKGHATGYSSEYSMLKCTVDSDGLSAQKSETNVELETSRLVHVEY